MNRLHVFDMDGTLVDSMQAWAEEGIKILKENKVANYEQVLKDFNKMSACEVAEFVTKNGQSDKSGAELIAYWRKMMLIRYQQDIKLKPGVKEYLEYLHNKGDKIIIASGTPTPISDVVLKHMGIRQYFDELYDEIIIPFGKHKKEYFDELLTKVGYKAKDTTVYEDACYALHSAKLAGCHTVGIYDTISSTCAKEIAENADVFVKSFLELIR